VRSAFILLAAFSIHATLTVTMAAPPDAIPGSPVPPLKAPMARTASRAAVEQRLVAPPLPPAIRSEAPAASVGKAPTEAAAAERRPYLQQPTTTGDAERAEIWNSPEMGEARRLVTEFSRRAARTSPREGAEFLRNLSRLPPDEMASWLRRFQERRMNIALQQAVEAAARQLMLEQAISRQEAVRQAYANINYLRSVAAQSMQDRFLTQQQFSRQLGDARMLAREAQAATRPPHPDDDQSLDFVFDPSSPRGYRRRVAAAMSLPGDLPPSDPRNFIRGEEGVDFGEWATTRDAEPPVAGVSDRTPPAAPLPVAEPAAEAGPAPAGGE
jgi:hypothetical protein